MPQPPDGFQRACAAHDVPAILPKRVELNGRGVLICRNEDDALFAVDELCPHKSESMAMGLVHEGRLLCPHHQYEFDLETGRCVTHRRCLPATTYPLQVIDGEVFVRL